MECIGGIFGSLEAADRGRRTLEAAGIPANHVIVLPPGTSSTALDNLPGCDVDDERFLLTHALDLGAAVVTALADDAAQAVTARAALADAGAEPMDEACHRWWRTIRGGEEAFWRDAGDAAGFAEDAYRQGFVAAQRPGNRGRSYTEAMEDALRRSPWTGASEAFRSGYERGRTWAESHRRSGAHA
jgi:hypothetical protein